MRRRVLVYVQHLLGIGHLRRAVCLARALSAGGNEVTLASGGTPVPGLPMDTIRHVQLPPVFAADATFKTLLDAWGRPIDDGWRTRRRERLLEVWRSADPHALVVELFPFGRRQMRFELIPLLEAMRARARAGVVVSSVRDVLGAGQRDPSRQDEMLEVFERYFDRLLVHADPAVISFEQTFRHAGRLAGKLHYTGYIVERGGPGATSGSNAGFGEVIVSAGGGAVGRRLLETAIAARRISAHAHRTWRVLAGINATVADLDALAALAASCGEGKVIVERSRTDFMQLLENCAVSVSQGGYNTVMELLQSRTRAVVVPFEGEAETEQALRARRLAASGLIEVVEERELSEKSLAAAVDRAAVRPPASVSGIDLSGAQNSAALLSSWMTGLAW